MALLLDDIDYQVISLISYIAGYFDWDSFRDEFGFSDMPNFFTDTITFFNNLLEYIEKLPEVFHDMLFDLYHEIDNEVNPISDDNLPAYNQVLDRLDNDTFIGSTKTILADGSDFFTNGLTNTPKSSIDFHTLDVTFCGVYIPSKTITMDLSWFSRIRDEAHTIMSAFILLMWLWRVLLVRIFELLNGTANSISMFSPANDDSPMISERVDINEDGVVLKHTTTTRSSDGTTFVQHHKV